MILLLSPLVHFPHELKEHTIFFDFLTSRHSRIPCEEEAGKITRRVQKAESRCQLHQRVGVILQGTRYHPFMIFQPIPFDVHLHQFVLQIQAMFAYIEARSKRVETSLVSHATQDKNRSWNAVKAAAPAQPAKPVSRQSTSSGYEQTEISDMARKA